ncbi:hypothetical protein GDO78_019670 [Eleutherodactylus coqui]|uniref:Secreted protein n=1 Tax=Eleutherodactylus coqui TaxID=57060 RepID=A0A8J6EBQ8_ELECQ|nr:hypothetical protein GDO78_019670 [Eleutherodactylus coqui]
MIILLLAASLQCIKLATHKYRTGNLPASGWIHTGKCNICPRNSGRYRTLKPTITARAMCFVRKSHCVAVLVIFIRVFHAYENRMLLQQ